MPSHPRSSNIALLPLDRAVQRSRPGESLIANLEALRARREAVPLSEARSKFHKLAAIDTRLMLISSA